MLTFLHGTPLWRQCSRVACSGAAQLADMHDVRGSLAVLALGGDVYALGGGQPSNYLDTIEVRGQMA